MVLTCKALDAMVNTRLYFKCENLQKVGVFKFLGAVNAVAMTLVYGCSRQASWYAIINSLTIS